MDWPTIVGNSGFKHMANDWFTRFRILVVEDNPADVRLLQEAFKTSVSRPRLYIAENGEKALVLLKQQALPDLIMLDLNLPHKSGHEVLLEIKQDLALRNIPIIVFSSSTDASDVGRSYDLHANCYVRKPSDLDQLFCVVQGIDDFWLGRASLP